MATAPVQLTNVSSILLPEHMTCFQREYIMIPHHEARSFVERVDYVSGVGYPGGEAGRQALGLTIESVDDGSAEFTAVRTLIEDSQVRYARVF